LKLKYDEPLSNFALNFDLRRYNKVLILANLVLFGYLLHIVVDHRR
jgi:hypothetical protein